MKEKRECVEWLLDALSAATVRMDVCCSGGDGNGVGIIPPIDARLNSAVRGCDETTRRDHDHEGVARLRTSVLLLRGRARGNNTPPLVRLAVRPWCTRGWLVLCPPLPSWNTYPHFSC